MAPSIIARVVKVLFMLIGYTARYDATKWRGGATPHALGEIGHKNAEVRTTTGYGPINAAQSLELVKQVTGIESPPRHFHP
ncbi:hypothetical protein H4Q26_009963 [Puccinia striiformis f. sp. tritici PST-130]|nr:hypothetical protein H4Q26_009963 [Puccinia striiformis f. sp. tritici PST-130]